MKKIKFFERPIGARTVYTMAGVSFCLAAVAVGIIYSRTAQDIQSTTDATSTTYQVNINRSDISDPRYSGNIPKSTTFASTTQAATDITAEATEPPQEVRESAVVATTSEVYERQSFMLPCDGEVIRECSLKVPLFCETMEDWRTHSGVDFAVSDDEDVLSVGKGKVSKVMADSSYGYTVEVDYGEFTARYCGLEQGTTVGIGQLLNKGDSIGRVGEVPCEKKAEKHLHFEVIVNGDLVDPLKALS